MVYKPQMRRTYAAFGGVPSDEAYGRSRRQYEDIDDNNLGMFDERNFEQPRYWESAADGKSVYDDVISREGTFVPENQNMMDYAKSFYQGSKDLLDNFSTMSRATATDKYKHAYMNCKTAQHGLGGAHAGALASNAREFIDRLLGKNTPDSSEGDQYANRIGRFLGGKYPDDDCDELVQRYIKKRY